MVEGRQESEKGQDRGKYKERLSGKGDRRKVESERERRIRKLDKKEKKRKRRQRRKVDIGRERRIGKLDKTKKKKRKKVEEGRKADYEGTGRSDDGGSGGETRQVFCLL